MAISRQKKEESVAELKGKFQVSAAIVAADNLGLTGEEATALRRQAREAGCAVKVAKNRLIKLALKEASRPALDDYLLGPTVLITHPDDPVTPAKIFADFAKKCERLKVKGGILREDVLDAAAVNHLAQLPGRDQLRSEFAGLINNLTGVVYFSAQNLLGEFTGLVDAQKEQAPQAA